MLQAALGKLRHMGLWHNGKLPCSSVQMKCRPWSLSSSQHMQHLRHCSDSQQIKPHLPVSVLVQLVIAAVKLCCIWQVGHLLILKTEQMSMKEPTGLVPWQLST